MDFELDAAQRAWLTEVREFLDENATPELRAELARHDLEFPDGEVARFRRKIGEKGWFGLNWPREYGGLGRGAVDHAARHRAEQNRMAAADCQKRNDLRRGLFRA